jgi:hypothetical protein
MPAVDDKGVVTVLYEDFKGDRRDFENLEGPVFEDPFALVVTRSTDGGKTWTAGDEFESGVIPTRRFLVYLPESPSLAVSHDGTIYATWMDGRDGDEDVFLKKSSDGAKTWSAPIRVNNNPKGDGTNQYLPRVSIGGGGRVNVLFLDRRRDPRNIMTDAELATSTDGGKTFTNRRISSQSFDGTIGPMVSELTGADFGTHLGLDSWGNHVLAAWTDTREGSQADGQQDIATTHVTFPATVPFLGQPVVIIVLFVIGAVALAMALREGRRPEPTVVKETAKA